MVKALPRVGVVIDPKIRYENIGDSFFEMVGKRFRLAMLPGGKPSRAQLERLIADSDAIVTGWGTPPIALEIIEATKKLRLVVHAQGSVKGLPYEAILKKGIVLTNSAASYARTMCEATIGMMLALGYHMAYAHRRFSQLGDQTFDRSKVLGIGLDKKSVGIIGLGPIGSELARMLSAFNVKLFAYDPYAKRALAKRLKVTLVEKVEELAKKCQVVTVHCGWTKETTGLVTRKFLERMGPRGMFICNARMPIVDEDALFDLLKAGRIYAALNLIPLRKDLWLSPDLRGLPNLLMTHGSSNVSDTWYDQVSCNVAQQLINFFEGKPVSPQLTLEQVARST